MSSLSHSVFFFLLSPSCLQMHTGGKKEKKKPFFLCHNYYHNYSDDYSDQWLACLFEPLYSECPPGKAEKKTLQAERNKQSV